MAALGAKLHTSLEHFYVAGFADMVTTGYTYWFYLNTETDRTLVLFPFYRNSIGVSNRLTLLIQF